MWHTVAPLLAEHRTVVATDLTGYGASSRPAPTADHQPHSKRAMADEQVAVMHTLGFDRFAVAGHDRGGRVGYRMALDHPERVERLAVFDVVPTGEVWRRADAAFAKAYWHWAFLAQPSPLPERLIGGDPQAFFDLHVRAGMGLGAAAGRYPPEVLADLPARRSTTRRRWRRCARTTGPAPPSTSPTTTPTAATGGRSPAPSWSSGRRTAHCPRFYADVVEVWRTWANDVRGVSLDASHFLVEDRPADVASLLLDYPPRPPATPPQRGMPMTTDPAPTTPTDAGR